MAGRVVFDRRLGRKPASRRVHHQEREAVRDAHPCRVQAGNPVAEPASHGVHLPELLRFERHPESGPVVAARRPEGGDLRAHPLTQQLSRVGEAAGGQHNARAGTSTGPPAQYATTAVTWPRPVSSLVTRRPHPDLDTAAFDVLAEQVP